MILPSTLVGQDCSVDGLIPRPTAGAAKNWQIAERKTRGKIEKEGAAEAFKNPVIQSLI